MHTPEEQDVLDHAKRLIASAPIPVVVRKQNRRGLNRIFIGHKLGDGEFHCALANGKLTVFYRHPWKIRHIQQCNLIAEAVALLGVRYLPPFYVNFADKPDLNRSRQITIFGNCSVEGYADVAAPDFIYNGWPEAKFENFDEKARSLANASSADPTFDRAFWTGRILAPAREALAEFSKNSSSSVEIVDSTPNYNDLIHLYQTGFMTMEEQVAKYRYMIDVEGTGYSGRLKLLLHARRAVLMLDRPYKEYFYDDLEPFRHYVPVLRYSSNILERVDWLRSNPAREAEIIKEAQHFARERLTRAKAIESWAKLLEQHIAAGGRLRFKGEKLPRPLT
jgi:hypothetical protein